MRRAAAAAAAIALFAAGCATKSFNVGFGEADGAPQFMVDGRPLQIRAGELVPQRIPREYWRHRVQMCRAMGLNAVSCYFMWNGFELEDGSFDFKTGSRDVAAFLGICRDEGMWVLFRPGPYVCCEWDFGGLPVRLLKDSSIKIRSSDPRYMAECLRYLNAIADVAEPYLARNGGPIVLVQLENEYGSWADKDLDYIRALKAFWKGRGFGPMYMADGAQDKFLKDLVYPDPEIAIGLNSITEDNALKLARKYNPGVPAISAETYPGWLTHWGEEAQKPRDLSGALKWLMEKSCSFSLFLAHGGTSFGFTAGANGGGEGGYEPDITSYDFAAPVDEQGNATEAFHVYRKLIFDALGETPPPVPEPVPTMEFGEVKMEFFAPLRANTAGETRAERPVSFEEMDQNQGMAFYSTVIPAGGEQMLEFDRIGDRAQFFLDGRQIALADRRFTRPKVKVPARKAPATLEVAVEGMGHINFGPRMVAKKNRKGLFAPVVLDGKELLGWRMRLRPLDEKFVMAERRADDDGLPGGHFKGVLVLDSEPADTFIDMTGWTKGVLYVNGRNLGRYWNVGPQTRLYCPASWLRKGQNIFDVVDIEQKVPSTLRGFKTAGN